MVALSIRLLTRFLERVAWFFFFQAEDGIRDLYVTGVQTCALPTVDITATPESAVHLRRCDGSFTPLPAGLTGPVVSHHRRTTTRAPIASTRPKAMTSKEPQADPSPGPSERQGRPRSGDPRARTTPRTSGPIRGPHRIKATSSWASLHQEGVKILLPPVISRERRARSRAS